MLWIHRDRGAFGAAVSTTAAHDIERAQTFESRAAVNAAANRQPATVLAAHVGSLLHAPLAMLGLWFAASTLAHAQQDAVLAGLDGGKITLKLRDGFSTKEFFELVLQNTMEGFFADPLYGGNRGMVSWKMLGFPGARYDYRDHIGKHNVPYPRGPVSIYGEG